MGPTLTKERVGNMYKVESLKEVIESNIDTKGKKVESNKLYAYIFIQRNKSIMT